jgi:hypothetical protein
LRQRLRHYSHLQASFRQAWQRGIAKVCAKCSPENCLSCCWLYLRSEQLNHPARLQVHTKAMLNLCCEGNCLLLLVLMLCHYSTAGSNGPESWNKAELRPIATPTILCQMLAAAECLKVVLLGLPRSNSRSMKKRLLPSSALVNAFRRTKYIRSRLICAILALLRCCPHCYGRLDGRVPSRAA